jgi:ATP-dependent RNA helicase DHX33
MRGMIGCTQPRRVAAITVAQRVAQETNTELGTTVGYAVRFEDCTSADTTRIKYMTDGMLLREAISDPLLTRYAYILLDEVHERTVHTDVLLGVVKRAQRVRTDKRRLAEFYAERGQNVHPHTLAGIRPLKLVLMSATMDVDEFSAYFNAAPVFFLEGRQFRVDTYHAAAEQTDYTHAALTTVFQLHANEPCVDEHDILLFMTGQEEIEAVVRTLVEASRVRFPDRPLLVLPLYAAMPSGKQLKVFERAPAGHRKVIVATNIAETSITIRGIKFVVDTGVVKGKMFSPSSGLEVLKVNWPFSSKQLYQETRIYIPGQKKS